MEPAAPSPEIAGLTAHSGLVEPGFLFAALAGRSDDGRRHMQEAVARGRGRGARRAGGASARRCGAGGGSVSAPPFGRAGGAVARAPPFAPRRRYRHGRQDLGRLPRPPSRRPRSSARDRVCRHARPSLPRAGAAGRAARRRRGQCGGRAGAHHARACSARAPSRELARGGGGRGSAGGFVPRLGSGAPERPCADEGGLLHRPRARPRRLPRRARRLSRRQAAPLHRAPRRRRHRHPLRRARRVGRDRPPPRRREAGGARLALRRDGGVRRGGRASRRLFCTRARRGLGGVRLSGPGRRFGRT